MTRQQALDIYMVEAVLTSREVINLELDAPKPLVVGDVVGDVWVAVGDEGDDWKTGFGDVEVEQRHIDWANEIGCLDNLTAGAIRRVILQRKPPAAPRS